MRTSRKRHIRVLHLLITIALAASFVLPCLAAETDHQGDKITLTQEEQQYIMDNPTVTIAIDTSWTPYGFCKLDGSCGGIIPNLFTEVVNKAGLKAEFVAQSSYAEAILFR